MVGGAKRLTGLARDVLGYPLNWLQMYGECFPLVNVSLFVRAEICCPPGRQGDRVKWSARGRRRQHCCFCMTTLLHSCGWLKLPQDFLRWRTFSSYNEKHMSNIFKRTPKSLVPAHVGLFCIWHNRTLWMTFIA